MKQILCILLTLTSLFGHGIGTVLKESSSVQVVSFTYSDGKAVPYAQILVYGPEDQDIEFQNGRTDRNGSFSFLPDQKGVWMIVINDGNGHEATTQIVIEKTNKEFSGSILTFD